MKVKEKNTIKTGSDFSGVGAFDYAIERVAKNKGFNHERVYACDWDKYARITYAHNHGEPTYYPEDVYEREIPKDSLDIYMTSPPCQSFSLAGKREGKNSDKGVLFFNSHEFIKTNKPRFFIFENVKGLLSDDNGRTFQEWLNYLGGKSLNGLPLLFKDENAVDYHVYYKVLNSKKHGVPQNRERIFIVGIRDDADNVFQFPKEEQLTLKLKDILEGQFNGKYLISKKRIKTIQSSKRSMKITDSDYKDSSSTVISGYYKTPTDGEYLQVPDKYFLSEKMINYISKDRKGNYNLIVNRDVANTITCEVKKMQRSMQDNYIQTDFYSNKSKIRRLTPRECFRLQDFPDTFDFSVVSDSQAYKQAGNSITVRVLELILLKLKL